ncbi:MAG: hypothetical protein JO283_17620 [Bradyrhizobium sp.]|nr:hypothetical protein [Bradyrhizobium sp.]
MAAQFPLGVAVAPSERGIARCSAPVPVVAAADARLTSVRVRRAEHNPSPYCCIVNNRSAELNTQFVDAKARLI